MKDRAKGEVLFWEVCARALKLSRSAKVPEEEFEDWLWHKLGRCACR